MDVLQLLQVAPLTPTVPSPTPSVGRSSLTDVDVVPILTARFFPEIFMCNYLLIIFN